MQLPASSCGRKVTQAVIWRKMDWISVWISFSDFASGGVSLSSWSGYVGICDCLTYVGTVFSFAGAVFPLSEGFAASLDLLFLGPLSNIWT